jgi:hypothetical protein
MLIYRIEHPTNGEGPYQNSVPGMEKHDGDPKHPSPYSDGMQQIWSRVIWGNDIDATRLHCAFDSIEKLDAWFSREDLRRLGKLGYVLATYEVSPQYVFEGKYQVVVDLVAAEGISRVPIRGL